MLTIHLIRHGRTPGNALHRYIGSTDEALDEEWMENTQRYMKHVYHDPLWVVSPRIRCLQTACILRGMDAGTVRELTAEGPQALAQALETFGEGADVRVIPGLAECDFGIFENKNYIELGDVIEYRKWVEDGCTYAAPGGEDPGAFRVRCCRAFETALEMAAAGGFSSMTMVVHGGTIMSIMDAFCKDPSGRRNSYFEWYTENGCGFTVGLIPEEKDGKRLLWIGEETI